MNIDAILFPGVPKSESLPKIPLQYIAGEYPALCIDRKSMITILYFHGNAETIYDVYRTFPDLPFNFVCPEYKGYGIRDGQEEEQSCHKMARAVLEYAKKLGPGVVVVGYSIGTGVACRLSAQNPKDVYGLILINPFLSIRTLVSEKTRLASLVIKQQFNNAFHIKKWNGRLLIICGKKDSIIPFTHGVMLYNKCKSSDKHIIIHDKAGHTFKDWKNSVIIPSMQIFIGENFSFD